MTGLLWEAGKTLYKNGKLRLPVFFGGVTTESLQPIAKHASSGVFPDIAPNLSPSPFQCEYRLALTVLATPVRPDFPPAICPGFLLSWERGAVMWMAGCLSRSCTARLVRSRPELKKTTNEDATQ